MVALVLGKVIVVLSVPDRVSVLVAERVLPSEMVRVEPVAGAVTVTLLMEVAEAIPNTGVTRVGVLANTNAPVPVSSDTTPAKLALEGVVINVRMSLDKSARAAVPLPVK
jgi:hypothetical protein